MFTKKPKPSMQGGKPVVGVGNVKTTVNYKDKKATQIACLKKMIKK